MPVILKFSATCRVRIGAAGLPRLWVAARICALGMSAVPPAVADVARSSGLSRVEREALASGRLVSHPLRFEQAEGSYVGGVSYQVVRASPKQVLGVLTNVRNWPQVLPRTKRARVVGSRGLHPRVELVQGQGFIDATYTIQLEYREDGNRILFWLDFGYPHTIGDVWGFFRVEPFGERASLVTVGAVVDLGSAFLRFLFEDSIQRLVLESPLQMRQFMEKRH